MVVGIKDIAAYVGLSTSTVSRALNGYTDVAAETMIRVQHAAQELGYSPSASARNLRRQRTDKIGLALLYDAAFATFNEYFAELIRLVAAAAEKRDYNLVLYTYAGKDPSALLRIAQAREVDGILLLGDVPALDRIIEWLLVAQMPFVILSRKVDHPEVNFVTPDNWDGARLAVRHLGSLGHRRIGHVAFVEGSRYSRERFSGYSAGLTELNLPYDESLVVNASLAPGSGAQAIATLLHLSVPPSAICVYNDRLAIEGLQYLRQYGVRVPQDLSVIGFDNIRSSGMTSPPLTTVHHPLDVVAEAAVAALLTASKTPVRLVVPVELVVRQSTMAIGS